VSFDDPHEDRTWVFDVTFLTSPWTCIYGRGCPGVLTGPAPELEQGCCSYGAHFTGPEDRRRTEQRARELTSAEWQFKKAAVKRGGPIRVNKDGETVTRLADGACIFLNRPGFAGGAGCALHRGATARGQRPMDWKPEVCWQLPLRRIDETDAYGHVTSTVREWKRRDWGAGGHEFHWWCTDDSQAFVGKQPVYAALRDELVEMCGPTPYTMLVTVLASRLAPGTRGRPVSHPALKKRSQKRRENGRENDGENGLKNGT
jgi:hypothetical protein